MDQPQKPVELSQMQKPVEVLKRFPLLHRQLNNQGSFLQTGD